MLSRARSSLAAHWLPALSLGLGALFVVSRRNPASTVGAVGRAPPLSEMTYEVEQRFPSTHAPLPASHPPRPDDAFEMGLRAAFPPAPELEPLWERAARRGLLMGRLAQRLGLDAWAAHSAGLFEECGKAVLFRHATDHYRAMLRAAGGRTAADETSILR